MIYIPLLNWKFTDYFEEISRNSTFGLVVTLNLFVEMSNLMRLKSAQSDYPELRKCPESFVFTFIWFVDVIRDMLLSMSTLTPSQH